MLNYQIFGIISALCNVVKEYEQEYHFFLRDLRSFRNSGRRESAESRHSPQNRQKIAPKGIRDITICDTAANTAADPSIRADTLAMFFLPTCSPMSMVIAVPMMLQGPPVSTPIRNMAIQQVHSALFRAQDTMNMTPAARNRKGLRKSALKENRSPRYPTIMPPTKDPTSTMEAMQPFCCCMPLLSRQVGSQNSSPQMQPFVQAYPITQKGTRGSNSAVNTLIYFYCWGYSGCQVSAFQVRIDLSFSYSTSGVLLVGEVAHSFSMAAGGFYLRMVMHRMAMARQNPPVVKKLTVQGSFCCWSSTLHSTRAMMLPTLALMAQNPISIPRLPLPNQFPMTPTAPGQPVLWKKPFRHMATAMNTQLNPEVVTQYAENDMQKSEDRSMPTPIKYLRLTLLLRLPMVAMPREQENRQRVSMRPNWGEVTSNCYPIYFLEQDHPSRMQCRPAQARKVRVKAVNFCRLDMGQLELINNVRAIGGVVIEVEKQNNCARLKNTLLSSILYRAALFRLSI